MNFAFLMDPLETINIKKDTTFVLMLEAAKRKHKIYFLPEGGITKKNDNTYFHVLCINPQKNKQQPFVKIGADCLNEEQVDVIFIRTDPPFDDDYLLHTWLLDLMPKNIFIINHPSGIRTANEKIWLLRFKNLVPPSLVSLNKENILSFLNKNKKIIAKPTNSYGGQNVFLIGEKDLNAMVILENLTHNWKKHIIVQKYLKEAAFGDKRILLLDGEPLGAVLRLHNQRDHRNNFFSGGTAKKANISLRDKEIIATLKPELRKLGLFFVGIDIIGDFLIEVNVTSPTCLQEINYFNRAKCEKQIIDYVETQVKNRICSCHN